MSAKQSGTHLFLTLAIHVLLALKKKLFSLEMSHGAQSHCLFDSNKDTGIVIAILEVCKTLLSVQFDLELTTANLKQDATTKHYQQQLILFLKKFADQFKPQFLLQFNIYKSVASCQRHSP
jgi:hypothetical protein